MHIYYTYIIYIYYIYIHILYTYTYTYNTHMYTYSLKLQMTCARINIIIHQIIRQPLSGDWDTYSMCVSEATVQAQRRRCDLVGLRRRSFRRLISCAKDFCKMLGNKCRKLHPSAASCCFWIKDHQSLEKCRVPALQCMCYETQMMQTFDVGIACRNAHAHVHAYTVYNYI